MAMRAGGAEYLEVQYWWPASLTASQRRGCAGSRSGILERVGACGIVGYDVRVVCGLTAQQAQRVVLAKLYKL